MTYDLNDNVVKEVTPKGDQKLFFYDESNQLVRKELPDDVYQFVYNDKGNVTSASNKHSAIEMTYVSILGNEQVATVSTNALDLPSYSLDYGYNAAGKRTSMSSDFISLSYSYDSAYRMTGVANSMGQNFSFGYDEASRIVQINRPNDVNSTMSYDSNSFLKEYVHRKGSSIIESFIYTRDQIGNRTSMTTTRGGHSYGYDNENQLISASHPEADELHALESFTYDSLGNRTADNQGGFSYDDKKFRLEEDYRYLYIHDLNGNLISKQEKGMSGKVWNYVYSSENQMVQAELYEGVNKVKSIQYFYDVTGRRIKKSVHDAQNGTSFERKYAYDSNEIIAELDEDNNLLARYTHSGLRTDDVLAADISSDGVNRGLASQSGSYLYLKDGLGSVQAITTESGQLVQRYVYSSFGKLLKTVDAIGMETTSFKTSYTYTNREFDEETGLYYYRARYYDSRAGRFMQEDPHPGNIFSPSTFNSTSIFVLNNPLNRIDPSGKMSFFKSLTIIVGASLAGAWAGGTAGAAVGGPWGFVVGAVVGAIAGAITAIAINGAWNTLDKKPFFEDWSQAAVMGAIAGAISGYKATANAANAASSVAGNKVALSAQGWAGCALAAAAVYTYLMWKLGDSMEEEAGDKLFDIDNTSNDGGASSTPNQNPAEGGEEMMCYA